MEMTRTKTARWASPLIAGLVALAWAAWLHPDIGTVLSNPDVVYHVHRIERCLADFPHVTSVDTFSHAGQPYHLHWLGPFTLLFASIARMIGATGPGVPQLTLALGLVPPMLGAITAALVVLLARRLGAGIAVALVAGLAAGLSGDAITIFHHGTIDHHLFAALGIVVACLGWASRSLSTWALGHLLLFAMTPEATAYSTTLILVAAASECVARGWESGERLARPWRSFLVPSLAALAAVAATRALDPDRPPLLASDVFQFSLFHVGWIAAAGAGAALATILVERPAAMRARFTLLAGVLLLMVSSMALALLALGQGESVADRLMRVQRQQVGEELSLLRFMDAARESHWGTWATLLVLVAGFTVIRLIVAIQRRAASPALFAALLMLAGATLALTELRHARALAPIVCVAMAFAAFETTRFLSVLPFLSSRAGRIAGGTAIALIVIPPFAFHSVEMREVLREPARWPHGIGALCDWMRMELPPAGARNDVPSRAVFGPWEWGHHLNVLGDQPVVVDPFNHDEATNQPSWDAWLAGTADGFIEAVQRRGASHVVVTTAAGSIVDLLQRTPYEIVRRAPDVPGGALYMPAMRRHFAFRLDEAGGLLDETGRLLPLWISSLDRDLAILDGDHVRATKLPAVRLYEIVPGAVIEGEVPEGCDAVALVARVDREGGGTMILQRTVAMAAGRRFAFRTALPAPHAASSFRIDAPYLVSCGGSSAAVTVTMEQVRSGGRVEVPRRDAGSDAQGP